MNEEVVFKRKLRDIGNILGISIPPELLAFINAKKDEQLCMVARTGKSGKGICIWKKEGDDNEGIPEELS